ncbi:hypothetical protein OH492_09400 [Vibrio chagasii]|nr:hypothetical protein [Vibrio chagasii]
MGEHTMHDIIQDLHHRYTVKRNTILVSAFHRKKSRSSKESCPPFPFFYQLTAMEISF